MPCSNDPQAMLPRSALTAQSLGAFFKPQRAQSHFDRLKALSLPKGFTEDDSVQYLCVPPRPLWLKMEQESVEHERSEDASPSPWKLGLAGVTRRS